VTSLCSLCNLIFLLIVQGINWKAPKQETAGKGCVVDHIFTQFTFQEAVLKQSYSNYGTILAKIQLPGRFFPQLRKS